MPITIPVTGGTYTATPGEIFTIQAGTTGDITINGATDFTVNIVGDLTGRVTDNLQQITFGANTEPTVNIAAGIDTSAYAIDANGESLTLNIGDGANVGDIDGSHLDATGTFTINAGDNVSVSGYMQNLEPADAVINFGLNANFAENVQGSAGGSADMTFGDGASFGGSLYGANGSNPDQTSNIMLGDDTFIARSLVSNHLYGDRTLTIGDNLQANNAINLAGAAGDGAAFLTIGDNALVGGNITGTSNGDQFVIGDNWDLRNINMLLGNDTLNIGTQNPDAVIGTLIDGGNPQGIDVDLISIALRPDQVAGFERAGWASNGDGTWSPTNPTSFTGNHAYSGNLTARDFEGPAAPANSPPVAVDDTATTDEDTSVTINVLTNDTDPEGGDLDILGTPTAANGTVVIDNETGEITYTPNPGFTGTDTITYTAVDEGGLTDTATLTITVEPGPDGVVDGEEFGEFMTAFGGGDQITQGDDVIEGNGGNDTILAGGGNDLVDGGADNDLLDGEAGDDTLLGGVGTDTLDGGLGADSLEGGAGDDDITVAAGDVANGGGGDDDFFIDPTSTEGPGTIVIDGGADATSGVPDDLANGNDGDTLDFTGLADVTVVTPLVDDGTGSFSGVVSYTNPEGEVITVDFTEIENVLGLPDPADGIVDGADTPEVMAPGYTDPQGDIIDGADGIDDTILGNDGDDTIDAGLGDDSVEGGLDDDLIDGNDGNDTLLGNEGNDTMDGGAGDDTLLGGDEADTLTGGAGDDLLDGGLLDDDITVGAGDTGIGGGGDDEFTVDPTVSGTDDITVIGGETDEEAVIDPTNNPDGRIGDVLDLRGLGPVDVVYDPTDPTFDPVTGVGESGTATFVNDDGLPVTVTFSEIEDVLTDGPADVTPVANPDTATTPEDTPVTIDVLANDTDPDTPVEDLDVTEATAPNGTVTINPDGTLEQPRIPISRARIRSPIR